MTAYYNEFYPYAAQWLRNLIAAGHIAPGDVDERSITDVAADDLKPYAQCHFFAGIGVWSHALRRSGWADDRPVWTGSCPCQPFSVAGKGEGQDDPRHLWPVWFKLIEQCRPPVIFGEQVDAAIRHGWLDLVQDDLEEVGYATGAACLPAGGVGAPHIRQRLWFVAHASDNGVQGLVSGRKDAERQAINGPLGCDSATGRMEHTSSVGRQRGQTAPQGHLDDGTAPRWPEGEYGSGLTSAYRHRPEPISPSDSFWGDADWLLCRDGKWRPTQSCSEPLVDGVAAELGFVRSETGGYFLSPLIEKGFSRVGRLKAYGNAICPQAAQEIITAYMECRP